MLKPALPSLGMLLLPWLPGAMLSAQEGQPSRERELSAPQESTSGQIFARKANEEHWRRLLRSKDLVERHRSYDKLLLRARLDPAVEAFLKELALDESRPELAWTARLGLRELDLRNKLASSSKSNPLDLVGGPYGSGERLQSIMRQLVVEYPSWQFGVQELPVDPSGSREQDEDAKRVRVRTDVLGVIVRSVAQGSSPKPGQRPGLVVALTEPGSIAHSMQLAPGDLLLRVNGHPIFLPEDITKAMQSQGKAQPIVVQWIDQTQVIQTRTWTPDPQ